jgi:hypothetical protein
MPRGNSARWCIDRTMTQLQSTTTEQAGTTCRTVCPQYMLSIRKATGQGAEGVDARSSVTQPLRPTPNSAARWETHSLREISATMSGVERRDQTTDKAVNEPNKGPPLKIGYALFGLSLTSIGF